MAQQTSHTKRTLAQQTPQTKRTLDQVASASQDTSPTESSSKLMKLPGDCSHCMKPCTSKGKSSDAIQCEICYRWVHASCEGIPKEKYKLFNQVVAEIPNLVYCCKYNQCYSRLNQFTSIANHDDSPVNISEDLKSIGEQYGVLKTTVSKLGSQIEELSQNNLSLKKKFNDLISNQKQVQGSPANSQELSNAATTIAEELAERDRKKNNIVVYNFPEDSTEMAEKDNFTKMCKEATDLDINVLKFLRLGRKSDNRARPLLISLTSEGEKITLLSRAPKLRFHEQYRNVYIAPDMTKLQRTKHKKLVDELKQRKQQGEENLIIRNGLIVKRSRTQQTSQVIPPMSDSTPLMDVAEQHT